MGRATMYETGLHWHMVARASSAYAQEACKIMEPASQCARARLFFRSSVPNNLQAVRGTAGRRIHKQAAHCRILLLSYILIALSFSSIFIGAVRAATTTYYPSNANIPFGSFVSGDMTSLVNVDANYYVVRSAVSATTTTSYNPSGYNPLGSTSRISGGVSDLTSNDGVYMTFRSYVSQISTTSLGRASIDYRSNTGSSGLNSPKERSWNGLAWDAAETELSTAGSSVRWVRMAYSPLMVRCYEKIVVTLSDDGYLDAYVWTGSGWSATNNIGFVGTTANAYRCFDIAYEHTTGRALLVYSRGTTTNEIGYKTWNGTAWSTENLLDLTYTTGVVYWIALASKPTANSNQIAMIYVDANVDVHGYEWTGSTWSLMTATAVWDNSAAIATKECIAVAYEQTSGDCMFIWAGVSSDDFYYRTWDGSTLTGPTLLDIAAAGGAGNWLTLRADPSSDSLLFLCVDAANDLNTAYWSGSVWTVHGEHDSGVDTTDARCADFGWESAGGKGLLVWGTTSGVITYATFTAPDTWGAKQGQAMGANAHSWVQLRTNPRNVAGDVKILGAVLENTVYDIGAIKWNGATFTVIGTDTISSDTTVTTYECFDLRFQLFGDATEFTSEVEFTGSSNVFDWTQLVWSVGSAWTVANVSVTIQLYDHTTPIYPTSGDGYISYTSSATPNMDETKTQTITTNPQKFKDGSGNWKIKIKGVKSTSTPFDLKTDWIEYKTTYPNQYTASTEFIFSGITGYTPTQLAFTIVSQYDIGSVSVTIQVWNYSNGQYVTSGEGYLTYTSSATPSTDETKTLTITTNPSYYVSSGNARIKITGVEATVTQFQQKVNQVKLDDTYSPITKIVFTTTAQTIIAGQASAIIIIQTQDVSNNPVNVLSDTTISLSSTSSNGRFSLATIPWIDVTNVTITAGTNSASFYYRDTAVGTPIITAAESPSQGWTDATQQETVNPGALDHFAFASIGSPQTAGVSFSITIMAKDSGGNNVTGYVGTNTLSDSTGTISPTSTGAFVSGVWTGSVTITTAQAGVAISTTGGGKSGVSNSFNVDAAGVQITITSSPSGSGFVKVDGAAITTPQTYSWAQGSTHALEALSPVSGGSGIQYVWTSWSDGGSQTHTYTVPSSSQTVTANYKTQYYLTMQVSPLGGGSVSPSSGWYDAGSPVAIQATAAGGYLFSSWSGSGSGSYSSTSNPASITMNGPITETANFQKAEFDFSISVSPSSASISQGRSGTTTVTVTLLGGDSQSVSLSASGQPSGVTVSFSPSSLMPTGKSTMTTQVAEAVARATYSITITGQGGGKVRTATYTLTVMDKNTYVGGVAMPTESLVILAPYLILAGLALMTCIGFTVRRRHRG